MSIDHLVYSVPDLDKAIDKIESLLGIRPVFGGYHLTKGTKNALLNLGNGVYLELLAIDHNNEQVRPPRWMGVDLINKPKLTRWALKSEDLPQVSLQLKKYNLAMGEVEGGQRKKADGSLLRWELIKPLAEPELELAPFYVDWSNSDSHPTTSLEEGVQLVGLNMSHPKPKHLQQLFTQLIINQSITTGPLNLQMVLDSPKGRFTL